MKLGDNSARTALSLALALTGEGKLQEASALLNDWEQEIATADVGLALALAGQPERGIHLMSNAIRAGDNTPKMRQNLAYSYALAGRWREARLMAEQDIPADKVSDRIEEWAADDRARGRGRSAWPGCSRSPAGAREYGPADLSSRSPTRQASTSSPPKPAPRRQREHRAAGPGRSRSARGRASGDPGGRSSVEAVPAAASTASFQTAFAALRLSQRRLRWTQDSASFIQRAPVAVARRRAPREPHLVQLGSFASEQGARRAWRASTPSATPSFPATRWSSARRWCSGKRYWRGLGRRLRPHERDLDVRPRTLERATAASPTPRAARFPARSAPACRWPGATEPRHGLLAAARTEPLLIGRGFRWACRRSMTHCGYPSARPRSTAIHFGSHRWASRSLGT